MTGRGPGTLMVVFGKVQSYMLVRPCVVDGGVVHITYCRPSYLGVGSAVTAVGCISGVKLLLEERAPH